MADNPAPAFEYVPVFHAPGCKAELRIVSLEAITTIHGSAATDRGRLYPVVENLGAGKFRITLHKKPTGADPVAATGPMEVGEAAEMFPAAEGATLSGLVELSKCTLGPAEKTGPREIVAVPTFAIDSDILLDSAASAELPGFDPLYGHAASHAAAVAHILTVALPARCPHLYPSRTGMSAFVPQTGAAMPDLAKLANIDQLRAAQGALAKALACEQLEHLAEWGEMAKAARERFEAIMEALGEANKPADELAAAEDADENNPGVGFGTWARG